MADSSAQIKHRSVESASSTTDETHGEIISTVQSEVKIQTLSTATTTVKLLLGLLSTAILVALVVAVVDVADVVMNQQQVPQLKEKMHSLHKMTHELQTMLDKLNETELNQPPPATTAITTSSTSTTISATTTTSSVTCTSSDVVGLYNMLSCAAIHAHLPDCASGNYIIYPRGRAPGRTAWCDMDMDGGGWTVFHKRFSGSEAFNKPWEDYQKGFGFHWYDYWLGNDDLHRITTTQPSELRVELRDWAGGHGYAKYSTFSVGNASTNYTLHVGGYSGNIGDSLTYHNSHQFSTKDRDNDGWSDTNCATKYGGGGGWWYGNWTCCHSANLNGRYYKGGVDNNEGVAWWSWRNNFYSYKAAVMLTRPRK